MTDQTDDQGGLRPDPDTVSNRVLAQMPVSDVGIVPKTFEDVWRLAGVIWVSGLAPFGLKSREAVAVCIMKGLELGLPPMAALSGIAVINNKPAIYGDLMMALIRRSGQLESWLESFEGNPYDDDFAAVCTMKRKGEDAITVRYSVADSKTAALWGKKNSNGSPTPWITNPKRMLRFRARSFCGRDTFQDITMGIAMAEELEDQILVGGVIEHRDEPPAPPPEPRQQSRAETRAITGKVVGEAEVVALYPDAGLRLLERDGARFYVDVNGARVEDADAESRIEKAGLRQNVEVTEAGEAEAEAAADQMDAKAGELTEGDKAALDEMRQATTAKPQQDSRTWAERLEDFRGELADMGHDSLIRERLDQLVESVAMPAVIKRGFVDAANARIRQLDGSRGPATTQERTPDDEAASGPPSAPPAPAEGDATHDKALNAYRAALGRARMLVDARKLLDDYLASDAPGDYMVKAQTMYDTRAHAIATTDETDASVKKDTALPGHGTSKIAFSNDDDKEKAIEREAVIMRKAKTKAELDTIWANCQRDFIDRHVLTNEDRAQLEQLYRSRSRLVK